MDSPGFRDGDGRPVALVAVFRMELRSMNHPGSTLVVNAIRIIASLA
jgi:hypothetical protein